MRCSRAFLVLMKASRAHDIFFGTSIMASGSLTDRTVDLAVLCTELSRPVPLDPSITVVDLAAKCPALSISNFMKMFYKNGPANKFSMLNDIDALKLTRQIGDGQYSTLAQASTGFNTSDTGLVAIPLSDYISFDGQSIQTETGVRSAFNIKEAILGAYSGNTGGVGVDSNCWAPCSLIELGTQLNGLKYLFDICHVECSRSFYEAMQEISSNFAGDGGSNLINTRVSVVFTNQHPAVADVIVRFNFGVELLSAGANPLLDTPLSALYDGIDNVPVFRGGEFIGSQPLKTSAKCGNAVRLDFQRGADALSYFFNKTVQLVGQNLDATETGPDMNFWKKVVASDCIPAGFPFDVSTNEVYVLVVTGANDATDQRPMPVILPSWGKLGSSDGAVAAQSCAYKTMIVANIYIDLSCGKKDLYFPKRVGDTNTPTAAYQGVDASDVFITPIAGVAFQAIGNIAAQAPTPAAANTLCVPGGLSVDLENNVNVLDGLDAKAPACVGDYYVMGTEVNKFLQHVAVCNNVSTPLIDVSPIQCIQFADEGDLRLLGPQPADALSAVGDNWGLSNTENDIVGLTARVAHAFTLTEVACHPFAVIVADVCALPIHAPGTLELVDRVLATGVKIVVTTDATITLVAADNIEFTIFNNIGGNVIVGVPVTLIAADVGGMVTFDDAQLTVTLPGQAAGQIYTDQEVTGIGSLAGSIGGTTVSAANVQLTLEYVA